MNGCKENVFFLESRLSPGKRKRKRNSQKDEKCVKQKDDITTNTDEGIQKKKKKKKKNSKFKETVEGSKEKEKEKKEKKTKLSVGLDDSFISTLGYSVEFGTKAESKPESSHPCSTENLKPECLTQDLEKKTKKKKKVAFDSSPGYIQVKCPKLFSSAPKENILSETETVRDSESCSQVTVTGHSQGQAHDDDPQYSSDDINSQDLFITQKTFRALPSEPSSGEDSDKAVITSPQPVTQAERGLQSSGVKIKNHRGSDTHLWGSHFHQYPQKVKEHLQRPKTVQIVVREELDLPEGKSKKETFQRQMELNTNLADEKKVSDPIHVKPSAVNSYLDNPVVFNPSLDFEKSKKHSCTSCQQSPSCLLNTNEPPPIPQSVSTQTENFFTTELSSYLNFCQKSGVTVYFESLKPLDLSLPKRARKDLGRCLSVEVSAIEIQDDEEKHSDHNPSSLPDKLKGNGHKDPNLDPSCSSDTKEPSCQQQWSDSTQGKGKMTPSPQTESEPKFADMTTSDEENESTCCTGKLDLTQVRAVQLRLNEYFFFKTKGRQSLRPKSPLVNLAQSRDMKSRKEN